MSLGPLHDYHMTPRDRLVIFISIIAFIAIGALGIGSGNLEEPPLPNAPVTAPVEPPADEVQEPTLPPPPMRGPVDPFSTAFMTLSA